MKVVILAGGVGSRLSEETQSRPKPMVEIGGRPILWHLMKFYAAQGYTDFVICLGYRGYQIKEYFNNMFLHDANVTIDMRGNTRTFHQSVAEPWVVSLVETGVDTLTGGRLKRIRDFLDADEPFFMTYGDGLSNIDLAAQVAFHCSHAKQATVTAVIPPGRFGALELDGPAVRRFVEKPPGDNTFINGGFFILHPSVIDRIEGDNTAWEVGPLDGLAADGELMAYRHTGFWQAMDTLRDKNALEDLWRNGRAPWKIWA
jgi:glucose-1-phosphate cytidylyltransferase